MPATPDFPAGPFIKPEQESEIQRQTCIDELASFPDLLRGTVGGLLPRQLDTLYRNWSVRQIVHHIADSHINSYVRFKWALTEETPRIKAYDEGLWSQLRESVEGDISPSLALLDGLHARWCQLLRSLEADQFERQFVHPQTGETNRLADALPYYAWHGRHHHGQILWLRDQNRI